MRTQANIMLIEPDNNSRNLTAGILRSQKYAVQEAADFWSGISLLETVTYDVMLLGKNAYLKDSEKINNKLQTLSSGIPIIMLHSNLSKAELKRFMALGVYGFINTPYRQTRLLAQVEDAVGAIRYSKYLDFCYETVFDQLWPRNPVYLH